ncbi:ArsR/SmtB family transcription factor [Streptomyces tubercidicus]|uniref:Transcriptional regulator n=1 Tax=Streptomyces tubercidicus TaxID=47759 RepID=A0A640V0A3_9ACTN|nr:helix-turn-helix domain-containing protein [Streptomyces tubercidicus]WAU15918.1 helix-turn-helix domain-containing protein [Streptomyces tubercidicus]GFE41813.1 transcriptional regulator [Streptomyces tubercidicus]
MINIAVSADMLAATRFAVSPLMQAGAVLHPHRPHALSTVSVPRQQVDAVLQERQLPLLSALRREISGYAPDFMTPGTATDRTPDLEAELHQVAATSARVVARQMDRMLRTARPQGKTSAGELPGVRSFLERGERAFAQQVADELDAFWRQSLAPLWPSVVAGVEADIEHRARRIARSGLSAVLNSLHQDIAYRSGTLHLASEHRIEVSGTTDLTLFPSAVAHSWLISVDPWQERGIYLIYPTRGALGPDRMTEGADPPMGSVLGHSRSTLLAGLALPRTTTQLADRHHLSPSTVSYHLSHLLHAGLVSRVRERNRVYYRRTAHGERICGREASDDGASWAGEGRTGRPERKPVVADHEGVVSA